MKLIRSILSLACGLAVLAACQPKEEEAAKISVSPTTPIEFEQTAGTKTVTVTSNYVWEAVCDAQWVSVSPASGDATTGTTVTISALENTDKSERSTSVTFYCNNSRLTSAAVTIKQKAKEVVIETITVADFIKKADTTTVYRLSGKISNISSSATYQAFNLTDATGTVLVFFPDNFEEYASQLATGGTVTVRGKYDYYASKSQHELVDGVIESYTAPQEPTEIKTISVADFIKNADVFTTYRLEGTVNTEPDKTYCSFDLKDATGTIKVYEVKNASEWLGTVKKGGTVTLRGKYSYYEKSKLHEVVDAYIEKFEEEEPAEEKETTKISDILSSEEGVIYTLKDATMVCAYTKGYVVSDGTEYMLVYSGKDESESVGKKIDTKGSVTTYGGLKQLGGTVTTTVVGDSEVPSVTPEDITSTFDSFTSDKVKAIKYKGTLSVSKGTSSTYYNVKVDGATRVGSIAYPAASWGLDAMEGMTVTVSGWFVGISTSSSQEYLNIMINKIDADGKYFTVSPTEITAKPGDTSAQISVKANVQWTAQGDNPDFTPDITYGNSDATVTVKFSENTGTEARTAKFTFTTEEEASTKEYVVVITQKAPSQGGDYESNVEWVSNKDNKSYDEVVKIDGEEYAALKMGTGSKNGSATLKLTIGTKKVEFYAVGWKGKTSNVKVVNGSTTLFESEVKANDGIHDSSPYTIEVSSSDKYSFTFDSALTADTDVTISTVNEKGDRAVVFGVNASK